MYRISLKARDYKLLVRDIYDQFDLAFISGLRQEVVYVKVDGCLRDLQMFRDFLRGVSVYKLPQYIEFSVCKFRTFSKTYVQFRGIFRFGRLKTTVWQGLPFQTWSEYLFLSSGSPLLFLTV